VQKKYALNARTAPVDANDRQKTSPISNLKQQLQQFQEIIYPSHRGGGCSPP